MPKKLEEFSAYKFYHTIVKIFAFFSPNFRSVFREFFLFLLEIFALGRNAQKMRDFRRKKNVYKKGSDVS